MFKCTLELIIFCQINNVKTGTKIKYIIIFFYYTARLDQNNWIEKELGHI